MRERRKRWRVIEGHFEIRNMLEHVLTPSTKFVGKKNPCKFKTENKLREKKRMKSVT